MPSADNEATLNSASQCESQSSRAIRVLDNYGARGARGALVYCTPRAHYRILPTRSCTQMNDVIPACDSPVIQVILNSKPAGFLYLLFSAFLDKRADMRVS